MEIWAHRGASAVCPENTMVAFEEANRSGANAIELDVQRTRDGELIVIHDGTLNRTTNGRGYIYAASYSWIKTLDAGGKFHPRFSGEKIPTLRDVLDYIRQTNMTLNIEIKNEPIRYPGIELQVIKLLDQFKLLDRTIISSFDHLCVQIVKRSAPNVQTALLTGAFSPISPANVYQFGLDGVHPLKRIVNAVYMNEVFNYQLKVRPYTVNEPNLIRVFDALGVNAIITDDPRMARKFVNSEVK